MRTRLEIVSKLVEDKHITFEEGLMLMETVRYPLTDSLRHSTRAYTSDPVLCTLGIGPTDKYR